MEKSKFILNTYTLHLIQIIFYHHLSEERKYPLILGHGIIFALHLWET